MSVRATRVVSLGHRLTHEDRVRKELRGERKIAKGKRVSCDVKRKESDFLKSSCAGKAI
jgi:hypothetical protein